MTTISVTSIVSCAALRASRSALSLAVWLQTIAVWVDEERAHEMATVEEFERQLRLRCGQQRPED